MLPNAADSGRFWDDMPCQAQHAIIIAKYVRLVHKSGDELCTTLQEHMSYTVTSRATE